MITAQEILKMIELNNQEIAELPVNKRRELGARHGWKGYTRSTTRHSQSYSKAREELQQVSGSR
jgi:hypothetical protein